MQERVDLFDFSREERDFLRKVCRELESVADLKAVYAGSSDDVEHGILLGNNLLFIDSHTPEINLAGIRSKLERISDELKFERINKTLWKFEAKILGEKVKLEYLCADATKVELGKIGVYFVKVPLPKEARVGSLCEERNLARALSNVVKGGYFLERECGVDVEKYGFRLLLTGELSGLSIHSAKGNLYKKITSF